MLIKTPVCNSALNIFFLENRTCLSVWTLPVDVKMYFKVTMHLIQGLHLIYEDVWNWFVNFVCRGLTRI